MTPEMSTVLIALIAGLPAVLAVFVSAWTMVRTTRVTAGNVDAKLETVVAKSDEIHGLVNSQMTEARAEIKLLREMLTAANERVVEEKSKDQSP